MMQESQVSKINKYDKCLSFSNDLGALSFHQRFVYLDWSHTSYESYVPSIQSRQKGRDTSAVSYD